MREIDIWKAIKIHKWSETKPGQKKIERKLDEGDFIDEITAMAIIKKVDENKLRSYLEKIYTVLGDIQAAMSGDLSFRDIIDDEIGYEHIRSLMTKSQALKIDQEIRALRRQGFSLNDIVERYPILSRHPVRMRLAHIDKVMRADARNEYIPLLLNECDSIHEVAERCGVLPGTVDRAITLARRKGEDQNVRQLKYNELKSRGYSHEKIDKMLRISSRAYAKNGPQENIIDIKHKKMSKKVVQMIEEGYSTEDIMRKHDLTYYNYNKAVKIAGGIREIKKGAVRKLLNKGYSRKEVAEEMDLSYNTINIYARELKRDALI